MRMCRAVATRPAPRTLPTLGRMGGIWSMPATRPLAMDGTEPSSTTVYMAQSVRPNQSTAAGTQATDGRLCSPDSMGPMAERTTGTLATTRPSGVAMMTAAANPRTARCTDVHRIAVASPSSPRPQMTRQTSSGAGSLYPGQIADAHSACQMPIARASAASGGRTVPATRLTPDREGRWEGASRASRPAATAESAWTLGLGGMAGQLGAQPSVDLIDDRAVRVGAPLLDDPAGP